MPGDKSSNIEIEITINQIAYLVICGIHSRHDILQYIYKMDSLTEEEQKKRHWKKIGKSDRQLDEYIKRAKDQLMAGNAETREQKRNLYEAQAEDLYKKAVKSGKLQTASNILRTKMYLQGIGGFNVSGNFNAALFDVKLTDEQNTEYVKRMQEMYKGFCPDISGIDIKDL